MHKNEDTKMILTAPASENWKRPPGHPRITWPNTIQQGLTAYNLTLNGSSQPGSEPPSMEAHVYIWHYTFLVVHGKKRQRRRRRQKRYLHYVQFPCLMPDRSIKTALAVQQKSAVSYKHCFFKLHYGISHSQPLSRSEILCHIGGVVQR